MKKRVLCLVMVFAMLLPTLVVSANVVGGSKVSGAADIGVVMEISDEIVYGSSSHDASFYNDTYYEYTLKYNSLKTRVPIVFYAGAAGSLMEPTVFNYVKNFLNY